MTGEEQRISVLLLFFFRQFIRIQKPKRVFQENETKKLLLVTEE